MAVEELVWMGRSPHQGMLGLPTARDREAVEWAIDAGGERQRAWIAMALAQQPQVLLLDEPTTFLDLSHQLEVLDLVQYLNREHGITVVMVLHDLNQAARYAGRIVVVDGGCIHCEGTPAEVLTPQTLRDVFGVEGQVLAGPGGVAMVIVPLGRVEVAADS
jgi:iron complex transport system ATP-binding protein